MTHAAHRQAKAGLVDEAMATATRMQQQGIVLDNRTASTLLDAFARAGQPHRVEDFMEQMTAKYGEGHFGEVAVGFRVTGPCAKQHHSCRQSGGGRKKRVDRDDCCTLHAGLLPDVVTFNILLGAYAKARDVDGAYDAWCRMRQQGIVPDRITVVCSSCSSCCRPSPLNAVIKGPTVTDIQVAQL